MELAVLTSLENLRYVKWKENRINNTTSVHMKNKIAICGHILEGNDSSSI